MVDDYLYFYSVYGLNIGSTIRLPDLTETDFQPNVKISYGELTDDFLNQNLSKTTVFKKPGCEVRVSEQAVCYEWSGIGRVLIRGGCEVMVDPEPDVLEEDLLPFLTGPVLTILLQQRGLLVLHASSVFINGIAVAFLGAKGFGKSTLAAYMQSKGHQLVSDDIVPLFFNNNSVLTIPGYPRIKLYADSVKAVGSEPANHPFIHRFVNKHSFRCSEGFPHDSVVLAGIYVLAESENIAVKKLDLTGAFIEAVKHTHVNRYLEALNYQAKHFEQCQKLVQTVPFFELNRPHNFDRIKEVGALLENHAIEIGNNAKICLTA